MANNPDSGKPRITPGQMFKRRANKANSRISPIPTATDKAKIVPLPPATESASDTFKKAHKRTKKKRFKNMYRRDI